MTARPGPVPTVAAVAVLAMCTVGWAAVPMGGARAGARPALVVALACAVLSLADLAAALLAARPGAGRPLPGGSGYVPPLTDFALRAWSGVRAVPWAQGMTVAVLVLEAVHPSRPWHTAVLGVALLAFLLALHLAESAARPAVLRPQLPLIAAGLGLAAVSAGAAMLPAAGSGWLTVVAAISAIVVAALTLPA